MRIGESIAATMSFPNAEPAEDFAEQFLIGISPGDHLEILPGESQVLRQQFRGEVGLGGEAGARPLQRIEVPAPCAECAFRSLVPASGFLDLLLKQVHAQRLRGGDPDFRKRLAGGRREKLRRLCGQIDLTANQYQARPGGQRGDDFPIRRQERVAIRDNQQDLVRPAHDIPGATHSLLFDQVRLFAQTGGIRKRDRQSVQ